MSTNHTEMPPLGLAPALNDPSDSTAPPAIPGAHLAQDAALTNSFTEETFTQHDVVLGKGNGINNLPGNLLFRKFIIKYKQMYFEAPRSTKGTIAEMVLAELTALNPPGRFLEPLANHRFREVPRKRALEKTCQALREKKFGLDKMKSSVAKAELSKARKGESSGNVENSFPSLPFELPLPNGENEQLPGAIKPTSNETVDSATPIEELMDNDILYGGRGRRHFHRESNQRFLQILRDARKEYLESRNKKAVAKRIISEWKSQVPRGRFLKLDAKSKQWYEIDETSITEKICQALRDMKRGKGLGTKPALTDKLVNPFDFSTGGVYQTQPRPVNGSMLPLSSQSLRPSQGHSPFPPNGGTWVGQLGLYPPSQTVIPGAIVPSVMPPLAAAAALMAPHPLQMGVSSAHNGSLAKSESKSFNDSGTVGAQNDKKDMAEAAGTAETDKMDEWQPNHSTLETTMEVVNEAEKMVDEMPVLPDAETIEATTLGEPMTEPTETDASPERMPADEKANGSPVVEATDDKSDDKVVSEVDSRNEDQVVLPADKAAQGEGHAVWKYDEEKTNSAEKATEEADGNDITYALSDTKDDSEEISPADEEGASQPDDSKPGKKGKNRKNGELEAAALLANKFR